MANDYVWGHIDVRKPVGETPLPSPPPNLPSAGLGQDRPPELHVMR